MEKTLMPGYSVGPDAYKSIAEVCEAYGNKAVIIGGKKALEAAEDKIRTAVEGSKIEIEACLWYGGEASVENIEALTPQAQNADMIFAVGGGKAIDTAKSLSQRLKMPFFTFPTIASTCAACTSIAALYHPDGSLREYTLSKVPPNHIFIDTEIIANAPDKYLWAGIGDTMAKFYESTLSSRGDTPSHSDAMGVTLSKMCSEPIQRWGAKALEDCRENRVSYELNEVILGIIISTGLVSNFVQIDYTSGLAHAVYNGFTVLPAFEKYGHLHGEVVAYGILVLLTVDKQYDEMERLFKFNQSVGLPTKLADIHTVVDDLSTLAKKAMMGIDLRKYPYKVTEEMLINGITELEEWVSSRTPSENRV